MMSLNNKKFSHFLFFLLGLNMFIAPGAGALESNISLITGYNSNIKLMQNPQSSTFVTTYIDLSHQSLYMKGFGESLVYFNASYSQPSETDSNMDTCIGGNYSFFPFKKPLMVLAYAESGFFCNDETPADDYNWFSSGGMLKYHYSGKVTINFSQKFRGRTFSEQRLYYTTVPDQTVTGNTTETITSKDQEDLLMTSDTGLQLNLYPWVHININGFFRHMFSSIDEDVYDETGSRLSIKVSHKRTWYVILNAGIADRSFTNSSRSETLNTGGVVISRLAGNYEIFIESGIADNNSSYIEESYRQKVFQCGLSLFF